MTASTHVATPTGEQLLRVDVHDLDPYLTLTISGLTVALTRDEARRVSDALRAAALTEDPSREWR